MIDFMYSILMKLRSFVIVALASGLVSVGYASAEGFDQDAFDKFLSGRVGNGDPVYWYSTGTIRDYPSGDLRFRMEGFDAARRYMPDPDRPLAHQYNRKIYFYKDPETDEYITEKNGQAVAPIAYPYQFITYELKGENIETFVEQGIKPRIQKLGPSQNMSAKRIGRTLVVTAPVYLDFEIPGTNRRIDAFENYDFFFQPGRSRRTPQNQLSWVRYGDLPSWAGGGKAIYHLVTWRIDRWSDMPEQIRTFIEANHPLWQSPPASLEEIRALQEPAEAGSDQGF
ncbi:MAG: hypothetical protein AAF850_07990 [Pseudomonadota bacterium]